MKEKTEVRIEKICNNVLKRLIGLHCEKSGKDSGEQLIFPVKDPDDKREIRISEQELRLLFIEEFKKEHKELYYSIETPTRYKYKCGNRIQDIKSGEIGCKSGTFDMTIFEKTEKEYERLLNLQFKYNAIEKKVAKSLVKLIHGEEDGVFIQLVNRSSDERLRSRIRKLIESFYIFEDEWRGGKDKNVTVVFIVLDENRLITAEVYKDNYLEILSEME